MCNFTLNFDRTIKVLIKFNNLITKHNHFTEGCLKDSDVMIDKGKITGLGKLRVMKLIEVDLQLIISMHNYGFRKGCSIET